MANRIQRTLKDDVITVADAARLVNRDPSAISKLLRDGEVRGYKVHRQLWLVYRRDLLHWAKRHPRLTSRTSKHNAVATTEA
jgi:excisionase family DNA binding protein